MSDPRTHLSLRVDDSEQGLDLEEFLEEHFVEHSVSQIRKWVRLGYVRVNGVPSSLDAWLQLGDEISIDQRAEAERTYRAEDLSLRVLLEGAGWVCIDKPAGVPVIPERHGNAATVIDGLLFHIGASGRTGVRPRVVHRLDKEASGVLLVALDAASERDLGVQFQKREVEKRYLAIVRGEIHEPGVVDLPIGADSRDLTRMVISRGRGKPALTRFEPIEVFRGFTLVRVAPETGRTHQIRIHMSALGHTLAVDKLYGGGPSLNLSEIKPGYRAKPREPEKPLIARLTLHAESLEFRDPATGERRRAEAAIPKDFALAIKMLRKWAPGGQREEGDGDVDE
ncbi:MAG: RluA family pseudouridine synthase [Planctomycetes bacterium]|nr:RluA family pseudouridine synthase [Planctomycetota bacterium]MBI3846573.1 RluA family pseudouridine synthase [Planctomycetota bacterium]